MAALILSMAAPTLPVYFTASFSNRACLVCELDKHSTKDSLQRFIKRLREQYVLLTSQTLCVGLYNTNQKDGLTFSHAMFSYYFIYLFIFMFFSIFTTFFTADCYLHKYIKIYEQDMSLFKKYNYIQ